MKFNIIRKLPKKVETKLTHGQAVYVTVLGEVYEGVFKTMATDGQGIVEADNELLHVPLKQITPIPEEAK